jgi:hypothetical protein
MKIPFVVSIRPENSPSLPSVILRKILGQVNIYFQRKYCCGREISIVKRVKNSEHNKFAVEV